MIYPTRDAFIVDPPNPNIAASPIRPHAGIAGMTPPKPGVEAITSEPCPAIPIIESPHPHTHALGLVLALAAVALRR
ncbi:hypothetical protein [Sorangium sp. So ce388]|uniref:hypothetical protein n=1 Tax=Sorangium sp. So ce388 TaxID=3133309 RepID=UPI003F5C85EE